MPYPFVKFSGADAAIANQCGLCPSPLVAKNLDQQQQELSREAMGASHCTPVFTRSACLCGPFRQHTMLTGTLIPMRAQMHSTSEILSSLQRSVSTPGFLFFRKFRYIAYRQLVRWTWGLLGPEIRVPLPACAVTRIRSRFPGPPYTGFLPSLSLPFW